MFLIHLKSWCNTNLLKFTVLCLNCPVLRTFANKNGVKVWNVYQRFRHIAHDVYMSKVSAYFRSATYQFGMYIRSNMSSHLS